MDSIENIYGAGSIALRGSANNVDALIKSLFGIAKDSVDGFGSLGD